MNESKSNEHTKKMGGNLQKKQNIVYLLLDNLSFNCYYYWHIFLIFEGFRIVHHI